MTMIINPYAFGGGGLSPAYRYWRIYVTANNGDSFLSMNEVELRLTSGGVDQTLPVGSGGVTAASNDYFGANGAAAVNDNTSDVSAFVANWSGGPQWWYYDFGSGNSKAIAQVGIWPESTSSYTRAPRDFIIQGSPDASTWTDLATYTSITGWSSYGAGGGGYRTFNTF